jgi:glucokinase
MGARALIAEVGSQVCRFALLEGLDAGRPVFARYHETAVADHADIFAAFAEYSRLVEDRLPPFLGLAVAAPVNAEEVVITQSGWRFRPEAVRDAFGFDRVVAMNEAAATAAALNWLEPVDTLPIGGAHPASPPLQPGRYAIVSPDYGLGVSAVDIDAHGCRVIDSEGGHVSFAPTNALEIEVLKRLTEVYGRVSYERVVSWGGLAQLHAALCQQEGVERRALSPLEILLYARTGADPLCARALDCFLDILGDFAGDMALALGANRGVFLTGRFIMEAQSLIGTSSFRSRFESKGRLSAVVQALPTWAVVNPGGAVIGMGRLVAELLGDAREAFRTVRPEPAPLVKPEQVSGAAGDSLAAELLEHSTAGLLVVDSESRILASNERFWAGSSIPQPLRSAGATGAACAQAFLASGEWDPELHAQARQRMLAREPYSMERRVFGGRVLREDARPTPSGGWVITAQDVTQSTRRAAELEAIAADLREAKAQAEAADRAKTAFLATMSHEIRTPLNGVLGMAQAMSFDQLSPVQAERLDVIRQSGEALLAILNDILDLSKIEAGKLELEELEFDLEELMRGAHSAFTALANKKGLSFALTTDPSAAGVYRGDPTRLRQILYNLISNAIKFTESGEVRVTARFVDGRLMLAVADTGVGVPADRIDSLFEKFVQADASTTRRFGGTGLGLAICRQLAEMMGGTIAVDSELGAGACFRLELPLPRVGDAQAPLLPPALDSSVGEPCDDAGMKVLAAEDNPVNQLVLKTLLHQLGVELTVVDDGQMAVEAWAREPWDVILMDVQMPRMDGPTAVRAIREQEVATGRPRTPIIALTANVMNHQVGQYLDAGMDGCVAKPLQISALYEALQSVVAADQAA